MSLEIFFIPYKEVKKVINSKLHNYKKAEFLSLILRLNTIAIIKKAGSGHIGTSFSAIDIFVRNKKIKNSFRR